MPEVPFPDMMDGDNFELMGLCLRSVTLKFGSKLWLSGIVVEVEEGKEDRYCRCDVWGKGLINVCVVTGRTTESQYGQMLNE